MSAIKILPDIYWVGAIDWNIRTFHGHSYTTKRGTTYNAYLVMDEKIALVDTVYGPFADEMLEKMSTLADRLYAEDRGDEGALILGAMKRLLKQSASIAHLQQNDNSHPRGNQTPGV